MTLRTILATTLVLAAALSAGCSTPQNLDLSLEKHSAKGLYDVTLVPPATPPQLNQLHAWQVKLATASGAAVEGARFTVGGGMPQHGHGYPTKPRVTRELPGGVYVLDGMKFSMPGWWDLKLDIESPMGADQAAFNMVVDWSGARK